MAERKAAVTRNTLETQISVTLDLDRHVAAGCRSEYQVASALELGVLVQQAVGGPVILGQQLAIVVDLKRR